MEKPYSNYLEEFSKNINSQINKPFEDLYKRMAEKNALALSPLKQVDDRFITNLSEAMTNLTNQLNNILKPLRMQEELVNAVSRSLKPLTENLQKTLNRIYSTNVQPFELKAPILSQVVECKHTQQEEISETLKTYIDNYCSDKITEEAKKEVEVYSNNWAFSKVITLDTIIGLISILIPLIAAYLADSKQVEQTTNITNKTNINMTFQQQDADLNELIEKINAILPDFTPDAEDYFEESDSEEEQSTEPGK